jgi:hypothetical protein
LGRRAFPVLAVERRNGHRRDGIAVDAASVDAYAVGVRPGDVERFNAAMRAKVVLRDAGVEGVGGQIVAAGYEHESIGGNDQMQIPRLAADRTVAIRYFEPRGCRHLEPDATTMTTTCVCNHSRDARVDRCFAISAYVLERQDRQPMKSTAPDCLQSARPLHTCH